ncbi:hypothetical protein IMSHALPRED_009792 [Imshaugia aleurites]|uniref:Alpha/beta hydrolase fold-3 domain-containing protein n=1 Tax=Imshaugia aleurites TaxID=172621 RepID=A0A8H3IUY6_9LECA|nr:hypothetical protein IMSHALPRED_009792 [Imshaugia aleurites]
MDVSNPIAIARLILPQVPLMFKTAVLHSLGIPHTSTKWDLKTELIVKTLRSLLDPSQPSPISKQQKASLHDPGIKGKMWISKTTFPAPEQDDVLKILNQAVEDLKEPSEKYTPTVMTAVEAEWTGYRANVDDHRQRPDLSERQHYAKLMSEVESDATMLYFHGGAMFTMDPCTHRAITSYLAHLTKGRVLSVRYRLAPQNPFPAALLDALIAYLSLLYPPPTESYSAQSFHAPVPAPHIVLAGDSSGGNICLSLVQLLLQINRSTTKSVSFHNHTINLPLPLPAACSTMSAWLDLTRSMPSIMTNACYDYLPPPISREEVSRFPSCKAWPTDPPRGDLYSDTSILCHPLVSPLIARDWTGSCPLWFSYGEEMLADEVQVLASKAAKQGVTVVSEQFEAMPHCFALVLLGSPMSKKTYQNWAAFCRDAVKGEQMRTRGLWIEARTGIEKEMDVRTLCRISDGEVRERMEAAKAARNLGIEGEGKLLPKL